MGFFWSYKKNSHLAMAVQSHIEKRLDANNAWVFHGGLKKVLVASEKQISTGIQGSTENRTILGITDFRLCFNSLLWGRDNVKGR
jgi:hypothetical protein